MRYSNELKVGLAVVFAVVVFIIGVRYFEDVPIFRGTYPLFTVVDDAGGLTTGNNVRVNGVVVGKVTAVALDPERNNVRVEMSVDEAVVVPQGSVAQVSGLSVLGTVFMTIETGPPGNPPVEPGSLLPSASAGADLSAFTERAPELLNRVDSVLVGADATFDDLQMQLANPSSNLQETLTAIQESAAALGGVLRAQEQNVEASLRSIQALAGSLDTLTTENADSIEVAVRNLNAALTTLNRNMDELEATTATLNSILYKIDNGVGTAGLLVNDPELYNRLDAAATNLNLLIEDVRANPRRYLRELKLVDIF